MHSFHQSRGRILFEVFCALAIGASCVGAWMQTGASAFLPAAFVAALYGLWHATDMRRREPALAVDAGVAALATDDQGDLLDYLDAPEPEALVEEPEATWPIEQAEPAELEFVEEAEAAEPEVLEEVEPEALEEPEPAEPEAAEEPEPAEPEVAEVAEPVEPETLEEAEPEAPEEADHAPVAPLFEPQPFVRQKRAAFGRKAG